MIYLIDIYNYIKMRIKFSNYRYRILSISRISKPTSMKHNVFEKLLFNTRDNVRKLYLEMMQHQKVYRLYFKKCK